MVEKITWAEFDRLIEQFGKSLSIRLRGEQTLETVTSAPVRVYGVPTGGCFVAEALIRRFSNFSRACSPSTADFVVDDICDSGATLRPHVDAGIGTDALFVRPNQTSLALSGTITENWIQFPWEHDGSPTDAIVRLLQFIGEDPKREGLLDTPKRVTKALLEMTSGYNETAREILSTVFTEQYDEMVLLRDIPFNSLCEHHMLPFDGVAHVGYIPNGKVVGLSKLVRLVNMFSRRLQIQERLTNEIAQALAEHLQPLGVAVVVEAGHMCMTCRGVKVHDSVMVTSSMLGAFREKHEARSEFLTLIRKR